MKSLNRLTLREMFDNFHLYSGLPDGLVQLPIPDKIVFDKVGYAIPETSEELMKTICYGQRLFLMRQEDNDFGVIVRTIDGYYCPVVEKLPWDEDKALLFGRNVLTLLVKDLYPIAMHLVHLVSEMAERERKLLHREPSAVERAAGIEKLNVYSDLINLDFLRDAMKCTVPEVLLTPYNECLVRFMLAKEQADFQDRYFELMKEQSQPKSKYHA